MKKVIKVLSVAFLSLTLFISKVKAVSITITEQNSDAILQFINGGESKQTTNKYYQGIYNGKAFNLYCKDPGMNLDNKTYDIKLTRLDANNQHDAGIIYILDNSENARKSLVQDAIRFYDYLFGRVVIPEDRSKSDVANNVEFHAAAAQYFIYEKWGIDLTGLNVNSPRDNYGYKIDFDKYNDHYSYFSYVYEDREKQIKNLVEGAIKAAKQVNSTENNSSDKKVIPVKEGHIEDKSTDKTYIQEVEYTYTIEGFDKKLKDDSILLKFDCPNCNLIPGLNVKVGIAAAGGYSESLDLGQLKNGIEILGDYIKTSEKKPFTILITFSVNKADYDCNNKPKYSLDLAYTGKKADSNYAMFEVAGEEATTTQVTYGDGTYVFFTEEGTTGGEGYIGEGDNNNDESNGNKDYTHLRYDEEIQICSGECEALKKECDEYKEQNYWDLNYNENNQSCKKYTELECDKDTPKATCNVYVSSATCSNTPSELIIREGTSGLSPCDTNSKVDVYGCVTEEGAADNIGNEYKQTTMQPNNAYSSTFDSGAFDVSDNRFCNVACIENYRITLPPAQNDNAGRYFQLSANIEGNKSCYTSKIKKGDQTNPLSSNNAGTFEYMFEEERLKNEEYYYMYSFYKAIQDAIAADDDAINKNTKTSTSQHINSYTGLGGGTTKEYKNYYEYTLNFVDGNASSRFFDNYIVGSNSLDGIGIYAYYSKSENNIFNPSNELIKYEYKDVSSSKCNITSANKDACYLSVPYFTIQCKKGNNNQVTCTIRSYSYPYQDGYSGSETTDGLLSLEKILGNKEIYNDKSKSFNYDFLNNIYGNSFDYTKYGTNISTASNGMTSTITNMKLYTKELAQCVGWDMKFKFNPTLTFDYEEEYINNDNVKKQLEADSDGDASDNEITVPEEVEYCKDEMTYDDDGKYKSCSGTIDKNKLYNERKVLLYSVDNNVINNTTPTSFFISDALTAYQKIDVAQNYSTPVQFRTLSPSGVIVLMDSNNQQIDDSLIIPGWPIEFAHQGVFTYKISVKDLGEYNSGINNGKLGRIWDDDEQNVVKKAEADKASTCGSNKSTIDKDGNYFCSYKVNCNDCPSECDPNIGICEDPDCPDCPSSCNPNKGACIVDGELNVSPRPVSPNNVNPNNRPLGKNWAWDDNIDTYLELKAFVTTQEIQESGENIFDVDFDAEYTESNVIGNNYAVKFNLTSDVINYIKGYNQGKTYSDNSLDCYPYTNEATNETFDGMFCYSKFIDKLIEEKPDAVQIKGTRPEPAARASLTNHSWWTTWDQAESSIDHWQTGPITYSIDKTLSNIHFATDSESQIGIGPAWK